MSLPSKKAIQIDENTLEYEYRMLNHDMKLVYHEDKCIECGFCSKVCPITIDIYDKVYKRTAIGTPEQMNIESDKKIVVDMDKCIWCGCCTWICPGYTLELLINGNPQLNLVSNGSLPEFEEEVRTLDNGQKVRKVVMGSITVTCNEKDTKVIDAYADECAVGAMSRKGKDIEVDKDKCILCFKCTDAAKKYDNISVVVRRDRFKGVKGEPSSVWNGIMLRVTGKEGKIKGVMSRSQNKLADSILRLLGKGEVEEKD